MAVRNGIGVSYLGVQPTPDLEGLSANTELGEFNDLYERCFPAVWAYAVSRVGRQAAEDVVSETFAVAWRRQAAVPADALPWLLRVARNVVSESYRREVRQRLLDTELRGGVGNAAAVAPDIAEGVVERDQALTALATLSDGDRELLMLVAWHGLSPRQATRALGCSRPAFYVRLHRARRRLERALQRQATTWVGAGPPSIRFINLEEISR